MIEQICDWIVLISAVTIAITKIFHFFGKPIIFAKNKSLEEEKKRMAVYLQEMLPSALKSHDLEIRDKYKCDREKYLIEISQCVTDKMTEIIKKQNTNIDILTRSSKDVLREKIMGIYHKNKEDCQLEHYEKEALEQYYIDYKAMNGNSYIDKYYGFMKKWGVLPDLEAIESTKNEEKK